MGRRRIECRVGRVGALWWRDNWPAARAAFKTCGGGVTIVISTGVRDRCGRLLCSKPKAGRLGGPWKAETDRASRHTRCMVAGIERCILCGCGADGQRFCKSNFFAEIVLCLPGVALAMRLSVYPNRQRVLLRVGSGLERSRRFGSTRHRRGCAEQLVDPGVRDATRASRHCNNCIVPQSLVEIRSAAAIVKD